MPHRATVYAQRIRARLLKVLGDKCDLCGSVEDLEFDHKHGREYNPRDLSYSARMKRYERETELGLIRLLCRKCNLKARHTDDNGHHIRTEHAGLVPLTKNLPF